MDLDEIERALGHQFSNRRLLEEALTHSTWLKEEKDQGRGAGQHDQQRLEYLGDAFLGFAVGKSLFEQFPDADEGELTLRRKAMVKGPFIRAIGEELPLGGVLRLGAGETKMLDRNNKVCEDTVEALVGAVLLDAGEPAAWKVVQALFLGRQEEGRVHQDPISAYNLQWQQNLRESPPKVRCERIGGTDHAPLWRATARLPDGREVVREGPSKPDARSEACAAALEQWDAGSTAFEA